MSFNSKKKNAERISQKNVKLPTMEMPLEEFLESANIFYERFESNTSAQRPQPMAHMPSHTDPSGSLSERNRKSVNYNEGTDKDFYKQEKTLEDPDYTLPNAYQLKLVRDEMVSLSGGTSEGKKDVKTREKFKKSKGSKNLLKRTHMESEDFQSAHKEAQLEHGVQEDEKLGGVDEEIGDTSRETSVDMDEREPRTREVSHNRDMEDDASVKNLLEQEKKENRRLRKELAIANRIIDCTKSAADHFSKAIVMCEQRCEEMKRTEMKAIAESEKKDEKIDLLRGKKQELKEKNQKLEEKVVKLNEKVLSNIQQGLENLTAAKDKWREKKNKLKQEVAALQEAAQTHDQEKEGWKARRGEMKGNVKELQSKVHELEEGRTLDKTALENANGTSQNLQIELETSKKREETTQKANKNLQEEVNKLQQSLKEQIRKVSELEERPTFLTPPVMTPPTPAHHPNPQAVPHPHQMMPPNAWPPHVQMMQPPMQPPMQQPMFPAHNGAFRPPNRNMNNRAHNLPAQRTNFNYATNQGEPSQAFNQNR